MLSYSSTEADVDRGKVSTGESSVRLPVPEAGLAMFSFLDISAGRVPPAPFSLSAVARVLSLVALPVQAMPLPWPGARPVVRRTSPSGGSRHPTEFYLRAIDLAGLPAGWYHVSSPTGELCRVRDPGRDDASLTHFFSGLVSHANFVPRAVLVYSCMFRRNRYRYREPRTFRTIHMDVGHLMSTAQVAAAASGLTAAHLPVIRGRALAEHLGLDPLVECPLAASLLGTHHGDARGSQ
jgi:SagB-type dehydrogenase family enzyme